MLLTPISHIKYLHFFLESFPLSWLKLWFPATNWHITFTSSSADRRATISGDQKPILSENILNNQLGFNRRWLLTHWSRVTHICIGKLTIIGSDNGLSPERRQAIIWTNAGILLIGPLGTNFSEILIGIQIFSFKKMHLKILSAKWHPFCLGFNELSHSSTHHKISSMCWINIIHNLHFEYNTIYI